MCARNEGEGCVIMAAWWAPLTASLSEPILEASLRNTELLVCCNKALPQRIILRAPL